MSFCPQCGHPQDAHCIRCNLCNPGQPTTFGIQQDRIAELEQSHASLTRQLAASNEQIRILMGANASLVLELKDVKGSASQALTELERVRADCVDQVARLVSQHASAMDEMSRRIESLKSCIQWARGREKNWRGVHVDIVNAKLEEAIRG